MTRPSVLFDLFNTLIPGGTRSDRDDVSRRMADELGVDQDALADLVRATFDGRVRGRLGDLRSTVTWLAAELGGSPDAMAIDRAVRLRLEMTSDLHARTWAIPALTDLRERGIRLGLVTDCSGETPELWGQSRLAGFFDAVSFSCVTGHRKPEPGAYLAATDELDVSPADCLFVGDGGSEELTGAAALGMTGVRFVPAGPDVGEPIDEDRSWTGAEITDLRQVCGLVEQWESG